MSRRKRAGGPSGAITFVRFSLLLIMIGAAAALLSACGSSGGSASASGTASGSTSGNPRNCSTLRVYTTEGAAPPALLKPFEEKYGVPVSVAYSTTPAEVLAKLAAGGTKQYDLVFNEAGILRPTIEAGVIKPIDPAKLSEFPHLLKFVSEQFDSEGQLYGVAAFWDVNPFLYSTDVLSKPPTSWAELWSPKLKDQVSLWEDYSMLYVGASVLGYDKEPEQLWNLSEEQLTKIKEKMLELKGNVRTMWSSGGDLIQLYANKEVSASMSWAYIYHELKKKGEPVAKANLADMGAQAWTEGAEMSSEISPDCEAAAYAYLNAMISPKGQAALAESAGYSPVNQAAAKYMSKELIEETGVEDPKAFLGSAIFKQAPTDPEAYNEVMQEIIAGLS